MITNSLKKDRKKRIARHQSWRENADGTSSDESEGEAHSAENIQYNIRPRVHPPTLNELTKWRYIGVCTKQEAEASVHHSTDFRLYHQWDTSVNIDQINWLPLTVVYRSNAGRHFHWLVRTMGELVQNKMTKQKEFVIRSYYIEHSGPSLPTLNELIISYENRTYSRHGHIDQYHQSAIATSTYPMKLQQPKWCRMYYHIDTVLFYLHSYPVAFHLGDPT